MCDVLGSCFIFFGFCPGFVMSGSGALNCVAYQAVVCTMLDCSPLGNIVGKPTCAKHIQRAGAKNVDL